MAERTILNATHDEMRRDKSWFELRDKRGRVMDRDAWVVLRATETIRRGSDNLAPGHEEEHFAAASAAIPLAQRQLAEKVVNWGNLSLMHDHSPCVQDGVYLSSYRFQTYPEDVGGTFLVLCQRGNSIDQNEWHVHPDLVLGLQLKREGDNWLAMDEGYSVVIRLTRNENGSPALMEIRTSHLKDFLAARSECLCVSSYRSRELIVSEMPDVTWNQHPTIEESVGQKWQATITEITEHGHEFGERNGGNSCRPQRLRSRAGRAGDWNF